MVSDRARILDAALVLVTAVVSVAGTLLVAAQHQPGARPLDVLGIGLLLLPAAALWWRRAHPIAVLLGCFAVTTTFLRLPYPDGPVYGPLIVGLITAVMAGRRVAGYSVVAAAVLVSSLSPALLGQESVSLWRTAGLTAWLLFLASVGEVVRYRRALAAAEHRQLTMSLRAQADEVRRKATEDRLHLARELHDVLGHHLAAIHVQANAGLELFATEPHVVPERLRAVRDASRTALLDVQTFLDSLRESIDDAPREPSATVADLDRLIAPARAGGVPVRASVHGPVRPLPANVDLAASRVIQEALTNVLRHAGRPDTTVRVAYEVAGLTVRVENATATATAADAAANSGGRGIPGMRARVSDLGGTLIAGPTRDNGWSVVAELPIQQEV